MIFISKNTIASALSVALLCITSGAHAATESATINITGTVVDNTCTPEWTTSNVPVDIGRAAVRDFTGAGVAGKSAEFHLKLKDCGTETTNVKVAASGSPDSNADLFKNDAANNPATNVGIALFGGDGETTQLKPGAGEASYTIAGSSTADLAFRAELQQSGSNKPTAGDFSTAITLTLSYD